MAKDLIHVMTGEVDPEIEITMQLPEPIEEHLRHVATLREREEQARQKAAIELRQAARELREQNLTVSDVGAVLGVSHQRAHQLVNS